MLRSIFVSLAAFLAAVWGQGASAEILAVTSGGAGGTTPQLSIVSYFNPSDGVTYNADFTQFAPINIVFKVSPITSPATYYFGLPGGFTVTNETGGAFSAFEVRMDTILTLFGASILVAGHDPAVFSNVTFTPSSPGATEAILSGAPGLQSGQSTVFDVTFTLPAFGGDFQLVDLVLTPIAAVPEPSTWATMLLGFAGLGWAGYRRAKRREAVAG